MKLPFRGKTLIKCVPVQRGRAPDIDQPPGSCCRAAQMTPSGEAGEKSSSCQTECVVKVPNSEISVNDCQFANSISYFLFELQFEST